MTIVIDHHVQKPSVRLVVYAIVGFLIAVLFYLLIIDHDLMLALLGGLYGVAGAVLFYVLQLAVNIVIRERSYNNLSH